MTDRIHLFDMRLAVRVGVPVEERQVPQEISIDLTLEVDCAPAAASDSISKAVDYAVVQESVANLASSHEWALIETLAEAICGSILQEFRVSAVRVLLRKPGALRHRNVAAVAVEMERRRNA